MITRTVSELADICGATLEGDGSQRIIGPASLDEATREHVSFVGNERYGAELAKTGAGAVLVSGETACERTDVALLRCDDPNRAFTRVIEFFRPPAVPPVPGVHPSSTVASNVELGDGASVGPGCVVEEGAVLGSDVVLRGRVFIGAGAVVGARTVLHPGVVLYPRVRVGEDCLLHAGAVIGSDGFGFEPTAEGWDKIPQCGTVVIEDDVEIGANVAIDCGRFGATRIGRGAKLDNLVHVAHNVQVGPKSLLLAQVAVAGSAKLGERVILAGQVGVIGHVELGDGVRVSAQSGVSRDLASGDYFGSPARPQGEGLRLQGAVAKLPKLMRKVQALAARISELEERS